ncbi:hypothetical protein THASP1DRAFT_31302 [Thamnocephalis sphaerospora]|uniref:Uncharacterized protein n=1 Tax=Thamnocephalis sphaerospora TaxID=78915 RepID=A0A4P9XNQ9_9FUNG|nr:hypothetical protein THASP1DRAFT_31302 [Thamnocephalis sphaerospora]|eukprot:RKP06880.1 hypothetical protein THASP1DRAFT_31302 [Thamnocephalis sphaerospora]
MFWTRMHTERRLTGCEDVEFSKGGELQDFVSHAELDLSLFNPWYIRAAAPWGGMYWRPGGEGSVYMALLPKERQQHLRMIRLSIPDRVRIARHNTPNFFTGLEYATMLTPSNERNAKLLAWKVSDVDTAGSAYLENAACWSMVGVQGTPTVYGHWLACISASRPASFIERQNSGTESEHTDSTSNASHYPVRGNRLSHITLVRLDLPSTIGPFQPFAAPENSGMYLQGGSSNYHLHAVDQESVDLFLYGLNPKERSFRWRLIRVRISNTDKEGEAETGFRTTLSIRAEGQMSLSTNVARYVFRSKRLSSNRVLVHGLNLFETADYLAVIDLDPSANPNEFVWKQSYGYPKMPQVADGMLIGNPTRYPGAVAAEDAVSIDLLDVDTGQKLGKLKSKGLRKIVSVLGRTVLLYHADKDGASSCALCTLPPLSKTSHQLLKLRSKSLAPLDATSSPASDEEVSSAGTSECVIIPSHVPDDQMPTADGQAIVPVSPGNPFVLKSRRVMKSYGECRWQASESGVFADVHIGQSILTGEGKIAPLYIYPYAFHEKKTC